MMPVFIHDCEACIFLGHYFGHDVYTHGGSTILARDGNEPSEYGSQDICSLVLSIAANTNIGGDRLPNGSMKYRDYVASEWVAPSTKAMCAAMAELFGGTAINQKEQSNAL